MGALVYGNQPAVSDAADERCLMCSHWAGRPLMRRKHLAHTLSNPGLHCVWLFVSSLSVLLSLMNISPFAFPLTTSLVSSSSLVFYSSSFFILVILKRVVWYWPACLISNPPLVPRSIYSTCSAAVFPLLAIPHLKWCFYREPVSGPHTCRHEWAKNEESILKNSGQKGGRRTDVSHFTHRRGNRKEEVQQPPPPVPSSHPLAHRCSGILSSPSPRPLACCW